MTRAVFMSRDMSVNLDWAKENPAEFGKVVLKFIDGLPEHTVMKTAEVRDGFLYLSAVRK